MVAFEQLNMSDEASFKVEEEAPFKVMNTGIDALDRSLNGGLPERSVVYISADAFSMAEVFLYQFTQARKTYYITTDRRKEYVNQNIKNLNFNADAIIFIDVYQEYYFTPNGDMTDTIGNEYVDTNIIQYLEYNLNNIVAENSDDEFNLIIDNFTFFLNLHVNRGLIKKLINVLYECTKESNCITYLLGLKGSHSDNIENEILHASDVIFDISLEKNIDKISSKLIIPKVRGMVPNTEIIKFTISDGVEIDTSRDIA
ncbi:RAD55 family ATPase [Methanosalsum natronophilum]|nr:RAD55 family ATPase [Methanosalsum natronophilum]MCS3924495.1 KaiC/GvpD/RAD55 family RecA-like ATPase [Methanosalsum natronophilum]